MSFLFASSHLPAARSTRPELEEEEEENVNPESLPRSGGVRASSHLEERVPESARRADGSPAPRGADDASDWPGRLKELAEQQRTRPDSAEPDQPPRRADAEREPDAEPDHDADEAPGTKSEEAPENENTRSWYQPPESGSYHPDPGFYIRPEDGGHVSPDHGFYQHLPEGEKRGASVAWGGGEHPSSQDWRVRRSDESQDQPPGGQRSVGPGVPPGITPASGRTGRFPNSRLFEVRPHPGLAGMTGAGSVQRIQGGQTKTESHFFDASQPAAGPRKSSPPSFAAPAENSAKEERQPLGQSPSQAQQGATTKQAAPSTTLAQTASPPAETSKENQPKFKVDPADESKKDFMLRNPTTQQKHPSDRTFGDHVRSIMQDELDKSPTARKLLAKITQQTGKPVIIQMKPGGEAHPVIGPDGSLVITINPTDLRSGTLSHEITHHLQRWAREEAEKWAKGQDPEIKNIQAINSKTREILHSIVPVTYDDERNNSTQDYTENEAMRASHIVNAEISAANLKAELEAMKKSPKQRDRDHYQWLIDHPENIAAMFWDKQLLKEQPVHGNNQGRRIPAGTSYGDYNYIYPNVLSVLNSLDIPKEKRVTVEHLRGQRAYRVGRF